MSKYSDKFKLKAVQYCLEEHHGFIETAKHFNIPSKNSVQTWVRKYQNYCSKGLIKNVSVK